MIFYRSRHCSANSAQSCVSFDSAIGDVYSVQTPSKYDQAQGPIQVPGGQAGIDIFDLNSKSNATPSAGIQFDNLAASVIDGKK